MSAPQSPNAPSSPFLTTEEVAAMLHLSKRTIEGLRLTSSGIPFIRVGGRRVLYAREAVLAWAQARTVLSTHDEKFPSRKAARKTRPHA